MAYGNLPIGTSNPGCIVILVDQSWSMREDWGMGTKAEGATLAVNRVIEELVIASRAGDISAWTKLNLYCSPQCFGHESVPSGVFVVW